MNRYLLNYLLLVPTSLLVAHTHIKQREPTGPMTDELRNEPCYQGHLEPGV